MNTDEKQGMTRRSSESHDCPLSIVRFPAAKVFPRFDMDDWERAGSAAALHMLSAAS
jgi:hypothetical protein